VCGATTFLPGRLTVGRCQQQQRAQLLLLLLQLFGDVRNRQACRGYGYPWILRWLTY